MAPSPICLKSLFSKVKHSVCDIREAWTFPRSFFPQMQRRAQEMINLVLSGIEARLSQTNGDEDWEESQEVGAGWLNSLAGSNR